MAEVLRGAACVRARSSTARGSLLAYGALGLPLAFAALPIYVLVPQLYAGVLGLPLALVGALLLAARVVDGLTDPLIGWAGDRLARRRLLTLLGLPPLALGLLLLLTPPDGAGAAWLLGSVTLATLGHSVASINFFAWGAELGRDAVERTRAVASREGFGLLGVVLAAALPGLLADDARSSAALTAWLFVPLVVAAAAVCLLRAPAAPAVRASRAALLGGWREALTDVALRRLLTVFAANGIAAALPSAIVLFYVSDVLLAGHLAGAYLAAYFLCGAAGLPLWLWASTRIGKARAWLIAMVIAIAVFGWAASLSAGDVAAFALICMLSGLALGADLALPPAMLADLLARRPGQARGATWFGLWNLVNKANLALAAGLALPLLSLAGYRPGVQDGEGVQALALLYGLLPVLLKGVALGLLWRWRGHFEGENR